MQCINFDYQKRNNHSKCLQLVWGSGFLLTKNMYRITILVLNSKHNSGTTKTKRIKVHDCSNPDKTVKAYLICLYKLKVKFFCSLNLFIYFFYLCLQTNNQLKCVIRSSIIESLLIIILQLQTGMQDAVDLWIISKFLP